MLYGLTLLLAKGGKFTAVRRSDGGVVGRKITDVSFIQNKIGTLVLWMWRS
ncbi:Uncharacterised protein [Vibrio cholerae]|nr:Uncharacterised protein [Vibrio cholerae]CSD23322.1 Uncharacterised protein [Vibrio cholerae]CSI58199.1 Uncharacterised protein [Vibrio cholerae]